MNTDRIELAKVIAHDAHDSIRQVRKYTGAPYWIHTDEVAQITSTAKDVTEDMICAAHLHDVLEDVFPENPTFNRAEISRLFGDTVLDLVEMLTDEFTKERYPRLNRAERKRREVERVSNISPDAKTIKLADILSNTKDIVEHGGDFARVYLLEKKELLPVLRQGDESLWNCAVGRVANACKSKNL